MQATFRFYSELNNYLSAEKARTEFILQTRESCPVKEMIELVGVPTADVDLILVNGESVDFSFLVKDGDRVSVYPVFESFDIASVTNLRSKPLRSPRFVLDVHLGKLARYLRMLGFDTLYENNYTEARLLFISDDEKRILLTRNRELLQDPSVERALLIESEDPRFQLVQVLRRFDLFNSTAVFQRCMCCNSLLEPVAKQDILYRLPPKVRLGFDEFQQCRSCDKVYWKGTHFERMKEFIRTALAGGTA